MQHRTQTDIQQAHMTNTLTGFLNESGKYRFAMAEAAPTASASGYAKGCIWCDNTNGATYVNTGTASSATWTLLGGAGVEDFGTQGIKSDVIAESTAATGVTIDGVLLKDTTVDVNGTADAIILDADGDTTISAPTDNQIDIEVAGADDFQITANTLTALSGSLIATNTINETTAGTGVTVDGLLIKDLVVDAGASGVTIEGTTAHAFTIDSVNLLRIDDANGTFAGAADTAGKEAHIRSASGGAAVTNGKAGGQITIISGGGSTVAGAGTTGGAGGLLSLASGAGADGSATGTGGAGGSITIAPGVGGNVSGAGTAGAGGNVVITPGAAGTHVGGTAGKAGGIFMRSATAMHFQQRAAVVAKGDSNETLTAAEMINGIVQHTVSTGRTLTTPTGANISAGIPGELAVGDCFYLHVITVGTGADDISTLTAGDGNVTFVGRVTIGPDAVNNNGYGTFLFRNTAANTWIGYRVG